MLQGRHAQRGAEKTIQAHSFGYTILCRARVYPTSNGDCDKHLVPHLLEAQQCAIVLPARTQHHQSHIDASCGVQHTEQNILQWQSLIRFDKECQPDAAAQPGRLGVLGRVRTSQQETASRQHSTRCSWKQAQETVHYLKTV